MPRYAKDLELIKARGIKGVMGIDEAGRGALAGPVVIAAVILDYQDPIPGIKDSKLISAKKRGLLSIEIKRRALAYHIVCVEAKVIDEINIRAASLKGFEMVYEALKEQAPYALIDGKDRPDGIMGEAVIKGDQLHACISAASILAKVHRDNLMREMDSIYPEYGFATHKGYATRRHYEALATWGSCPTHRLTFRLS
jgi:ribonuclease HII